MSVGVFALIGAGLHYASKTLILKLEKFNSLWVFGLRWKAEGHSDDLCLSGALRTPGLPRPFQPPPLSWAGIPLW